MSCQNIRAGSKPVVNHVSPLSLQVAKELVALHNELLRGEAARLERLRRTAPAASSASRREQVHTPSHTLFPLPILFQAL